MHYVSRNNTPQLVWVADDMRFSIVTNLSSHGIVIDPDDIPGYASQQFDPPPLSRWQEVFLQNIVRHITPNTASNTTSGPFLVFNGPGLGYYSIIDAENIEEWGIPNQLILYRGDFPNPWGEGYYHHEMIPILAGYTNLCRLCSWFDTTFGIQCYQYVPYTGHSSSILPVLSTLMLLGSVFSLGIGGVPVTSRRPKHS